MINHNQSGAVNATLVSLIIAVLLLVAALSFGGWAFNSRQDYKNNVDDKVNAAVAIARKNQFNADQKLFNEEAKKPLRPYSGPEAYGSLIVNYPKTWSAYVDASGAGAALLDGYFAPGAVPSISSESSVFALRVQVLQSSYAITLQNFAGQQRNGQLTVTAYALPKLPKTVGVEVTGQIASGRPDVTMIVLPLRSNTLEIWTQGTQFLADFNNYILPNFSFSP